MSCNGHCGDCHSKGSCTEPQKKLLPGVKRAILVLSGKGGVGKSTVAAALAVSLAKEGRKVGLLDVDFHGPSQPTLFGVSHLHLEGSDNGMEPLNTASGVRLVSLGLLLENPDQAVIWRGPVKMGVIKQLIEEVNWGELDDLVLDFPPGTGDESLSACQLADCPKTALIVTTPQEVALADCRKCLDFCRQLELPLLGIVENMSGYYCRGCQKVQPLFGTGGGEALAKLAGAPLVAQLPFDPEFVAACDRGELAAGLDKSPVIGEAMAKIARL